MVLKTLGALLAAVALAILAPFADALFNADGLRTPFLLAALLPIVVHPRGAGRRRARAHRPLRRPRRATRSSRSCCARSASWSASRYGVTEAVLGLVIGQIAGSVAVGRAAITVFRRFPAAAPEPLGEDRQRDRPVRDPLQRRLGHRLAADGDRRRSCSARSRSRAQVGYFRAGQAPLTGLTALTAPARLILITEQTRDWESGRRSASSPACAATA